MSKLTCLSSYFLELSPLYRDADDSSGTRRQFPRVASRIAASSCSGTACGRGCAHVHDNLERPQRRAAGKSAVDARHSSMSATACVAYGAQGGTGDQRGHLCAGHARVRPRCSHSGGETAHLMHRDVPALQPVRELEPHHRPPRGAHEPVDRSGHAAHAVCRGEVERKHLWRRRDQPGEAVDSLHVERADHLETETAHGSAPRARRTSSARGAWLWGGKTQRAPPSAGAARRRR